MITPMDSIQIVCLQRVLPGVVALLQECGVVHLEEAPLAVEDAPHFLHHVRLSEEQAADLHALEELLRMLEECRPLLTTKPTVEAVEAAAGEVAGFGLPQWLRRARSASREFRSLTRRRINIENNLEVLTQHEKVLKAVEPFLSGQPIVLGQNARVFVLNQEAAQGAEDLSERMREQLGPACGFVYRKARGGTAMAVVTYPEEMNQRVNHFLRENRITPVDLGSDDSQGVSLDEALAKLQANLAEEKASLEELETKLRDTSLQRGPRLEAIYLAASDRKGQIEALKLCAQSTMVGVIQGWAPTAETKNLEAALQERFPGQVEMSRLPIHTTERDRIPTSLENPGFFKPFEVLMALFKPPAYGGIDPSVLVGVFFLLFYGFILGDVAYGLAVIGFGVLLRKLGARHPMARSAGTVGVYAGLSAVIFGILFGEFLGDFGAKQWGLRPLWFDRAHDPVRLLFVAVAVGAFHVVLSLVLGVREDMRRHETHHAQEKIALLAGLFALGLAVMAFAGLWPFTTPPFIGLAVVLGLTCIGLLIRAVGALAAVQVMEVVSLTTNILSYCRLMALGIASVALAEVANDLARDSGTLWVGIPIALLIHLLNLCIGIFSPALHALRLNYVESLPKYFKPEGRAYQPFKKEVPW